MPTGKGLWITVAQECSHVYVTKDSDKGVSGIDRSQTACPRCAPNEEHTNWLWEKIVGGKSTTRRRVRKNTPTLSLECRNIFLATPRP